MQQRKSMLAEKSFGEKLRNFFRKIFVRRRVTVLELKVEELKKIEEQNFQNTHLFYENNIKGLEQRVADLECDSGIEKNKDGQFVMITVENKTNKVLKDLELLKPIRCFAMTTDNIETNQYSLRSAIRGISLREMFVLMCMSRHDIETTRLIMTEKQRENCVISIITRDIFGRGTDTPIRPMIDNYQFQRNQVDIKEEFSILPNTSIIISELKAKEKVSFLLYPKRSIHLRAL